MKCVVLGGTGEGRQIACALIEQGHRVAYSLAGITDAPAVPKCTLWRGGFGGVSKMAQCLSRFGAECLIDATHPYAARISEHAHQAAASLALPLLRYERAPWAEMPGDTWHQISYDWPQIARALAPYRAILFTLGTLPLAHLEDLAADQMWLVRTLASRDLQHAGLMQIVARGPFTLSDELSLMSRHRVDLVVSKNSGGQETFAKIAAARELGIPVLMCRRPASLAADSYQSISDLLQAVPAS